MSAPAFAGDQPNLDLANRNDVASLHAENFARQDMLRARVADTVTRLWTVTAPHNRPQAEQFAAVVGPLVRGAATTQVSLTSGHLQRVAAAKIGRLVPPIAINPHTVVDPTVRNVDPVELWQRPFHYAWHLLGEGHIRDAAMASGLSRALTIALTEVQLAKTVTAAQVLPQIDGVTGYRRITRGGACELCRDNTSVLPPGEQMSIHDRCLCDLDPVTGDMPTPPEVALPQTSEIGPVLTR